ncbi:antibiotic biosynthesis monooxygenase family protein [Amycolatopsis japonica]
MAVISTDTDYFTNVTVFTTTEENQKKLLDIILEGEEKLHDFPGLVSTSIHLSHDGTQVISYAQWRSKEDFEAMGSFPDVRDNFRRVRELVSDVNLISSSVVYEHTRTGASVK